MNGTYDPRLAAFALLIAFFVWFVALNLAERISNARGAAARLWLLVGAAVVGSGLWSMHLLAMLAFELPIVVVHHLPTMLFTLGVAVMVCFFALWIAGGPHLGLLRLAIAGLCMGVGLAAIHYLGLFAMQVVPAIHYDPTRVGASMLAAFCACWLTLALAFWLRQGRTPGRLVARTAAAMLCAAAIAGVFFLGFEAAAFADDSYSLGAITVLDLEQERDPLLAIVQATAAALLALTLLVLSGHARAILEMRRHAGRLELPATPVAHKASPDPLTGLANRALLARHFDELRAATREAQGTFALLIADVDHFRHLNASLGASAGDAVLREVAQRLGALVRPGDTVARPEGDEFALLLADVGNEEQAARIAARVSEEVGRTIELEGGVQVQVAVRVGVGLYPRDGEDVDTLLRHARAAAGLTHAG